MANFVSVRIDNIAVFTGAEFKEQAIFNSAQIEREIHFEGTIFVDDVSFQDASLKTVFFEKPYLFSWGNVPGKDNNRLLRFLRDDLNVGWMENAEIIKSDDGETIHIYKDENSVEMVIDEGKEKVTLIISDSRTPDLKVKKENGKLNIYKKLKVQFLAAIDLRGCIYDRIYPISFWETLMDYLGPYDRQPFTHLEEIFRRAGKDKLADDVYYERKCREFTKNITIRKPGAWLLDRFLWLLTGYGVKLYRLLLAIIPILILGTCIFHLDGAVVLNPDIQPPPAIGPQDSYLEAFWVSLNTFLPVVEIPSGADWKPSSQDIWKTQTQWGILGIKCTTFATLLTLAGWILVPVGVAGISGLLKRSK